MKRRDFLKRLGIGAGIAIIAPHVGMEWPKSEPLPDPRNPVIGGWTPNAEVFWRNVPANQALEAIGLPTTNIPPQTNNAWWALTDFTTAQLYSGQLQPNQRYTLMAGPLKLWEFDSPGRQMWTPETELLFPAGLILKPVPEPKVWNAVVRKPGELEDEWGIISENTGGRYLRLQNPDVHDPLCTCSPCRSKKDAYVATLGPRARRRFLADRTSPPPKWFDVTHYDEATLAALAAGKGQSMIPVSSGHFPGLSQLFSKENS